MRNIALTIVGLLVMTTLTACTDNFSASLLGGDPQAFTYTPSYESNANTHTMTIEFTVQEGVVQSLKITPGAETGLERAHQLAFSANVRRFVLQKPVEEISIPASIGEEHWITDVFRDVVEELKSDL